MKDLKEKTASGLVYKLAERAGAEGVSFIVSLVLARMLLPSAYGLIALVTVFITVCDVFVTYGFGNSLIVDKKSNNTDFSTCFYFGLFLSIIVYAGIFLLSGVLADFYNEPQLIPVVRVMGLRIPIAAVNSVQHSYVSKHMMFKKFFYATLIGTVVSGVVAIIMAYSGCGVWALVEQYIGNVVIDTICLFIFVDWRPTAEFSFVSLKKIYQYGWKIIVVGLIDTGINQLRSLVIAKKYTKSDLAYYNKGSQFPAYGMSLIEPTVNSVIFPALSQCNDNQDEMRVITRKIIRMSTYIVFPIVVGLFVVAEPLIYTLLTERWAESIPYMQIVCMAYIFRPLQFINNSVIKASGRSGLLLKLDIVKKSVGILLLFFSMPYGVKGIAWSLVFTNLFSTIVNIVPNRTILNYGFCAQMKDVGTNLLIAVIMGVVVYPISFIPMPNLATLLIQIVSGIGFYVLISHITRVDGFVFCKSFLLKHFRGGIHEKV